MRSQISGKPSALDTLASPIRMCRKRPFATSGQERLPTRAAVCRIPCLILCLAYVERVCQCRAPNAPCGLHGRMASVIASLFSRSRPPPPAGLHATTPSVGQTSGATQRCLNPGFSERIGNSRRAGRSDAAIHNGGCSGSRVPMAMRHSVRSGIDFVDPLANNKGATRSTFTTGC